MNLRKIMLSDTSFITEKMLRALNQKDVFFVYDLLTFFPIRYIQKELSPLANDGENHLYEGLVNEKPTLRKIRENLSLITFSMSINKQIIKVSIFNRAYLFQKIEVGMKIYVYGIYLEKKKEINANSIEFKFKEGIEPVYSKLEIAPYYLGRVIDLALDQYEIFIEESIPTPLLNKYHLLGLKDMIRWAHHPLDMQITKQILRRAKYEEFFFFELLLEINKLNNHLVSKEPLAYDINQVKAFISTIPFELTKDQKKACNDIFTDFKHDYSGNRLIEGDVGSGKTIVSEIALYAVKTAGAQGAFMAPTEILANQHYHNLCQSYQNVDIKIALLTSSITGRKREVILEELKTGKIDVICGTNALLSEGVIFKNLSLVITDEQHRFGVNQRQALRMKGNNPDVLYLSATPIPRTLAISAFGDMDISRIETKPIGRKEIITKVCSIEQYLIVFSFISDELKKGNQAYIIAPLIEENEKIKGENVTELYEKVKSYFGDEVAIVHGKMKNKEKSLAMESFSKGEKRILVSTTVIEVGVDVKKATVMVIFNAERFGLSQIHQLRGRVGRSKMQSYCFLLSNKTELKRLDILEKTNDGFRLAEEDLKLRGPGDVLGCRQSGQPIFRYGDFIQDYPILMAAMEDSKMIIQEKLYQQNDYIEIKKYFESMDFMKKGFLD